MADIPGQTPELHLKLAEGGPGRSASTGDRTFYLALLAAFLVHMFVLVGITTSKPRALGKEDGSDDPMAVSVITEEQFRQSQSTEIESQPSPTPVAPLEAPPPKPEQQSKPEKPEPSEAQKQPQTPPLEKQVPEQPTKEAVEKPQEVKEPKANQTESEDATVAELEETLPDLLSFESETGLKKKQKKESSKGSQAAQTAPAKPVSKPPPSRKPSSSSRRTAALDLSLPPSVAAESLSTTGLAGGAAAMSRPPGITKSGWNEDFARRVVRALRETMPQMRETRGRVTVKISLTQDGEIEELRIITPSKVNILDQSVVFAVRQTSFPFPPVGATAVDRTFLVTYVYR